MNWVNIKTTKPKHEQKVLITDGKIVTAAQADTESFPCIWWDECEFKGHDFYWTFNTDSITHWAVLPEPPKE